MDDAALLARTIQAETEALLQRQRRSGFEYRFRAGLGRPVELSDEALTCEPTLEVAARPPRGLGVGARPSAPLPAVRAAARGREPPAHHPDAYAAALRRGDADSKLGDYDPKAVLEHDHRALVESVAQLRMDASRARHEAERLGLREREADAELAGIRYEDEVSSEHSAWRGTIQAFRERISGFRASLEDVEAYGATLRHVLLRDLADRVAHQATLEALEAGLRAQRGEAERHTALLLLVLRSRDAELGELTRVRAEARRFLALLDGKLEARRVEVQARQEKARWRRRALEAERAMRARAEGELTAEGERALIDAARNQARESAEIIALRMRVQGAADAAEAIFNHVRFASGAPASAYGGGHAQAVGGAAAASPPSDLAFPPFEEPDPEPIIERYSALGDDAAAIEATLLDLSQRLGVLQQQEAELRAVEAGVASGGCGGPAKLDGQQQEEAEEHAGRPPGLGDILAAEFAAARLDAAAAGADLERSSAAKGSLERALCAVERHLRALLGASAPPAELDLPPTSDADAATAAAFAALDDAAARTAERRRGELDLIDEGAGSRSWAAAMHDSLARAAADLSVAWRRQEPAAALAALRAAVSWGRHEAGDAAWQLEVASGVAASPREDDADERAAEARDNAVDGEIERLLQASGTVVRVAALGRGGEPRPRATKSAITMAINDATAAFDRAWLEGPAGGGAVAAAKRDAAAKAAAASEGAAARADPYSRSASQQRRRASRAEIYTYFAEVAAAAGEDAGDDAAATSKARGAAAAALQAEGGGAVATPWGIMSGRRSVSVRPPPSAAPDAAARAGSPGPAALLAASGAGGGAAGGPAASGAPPPPPPEKPPTRDVQRLLAAAVSLGGGSVEDYLLAEHDPEDVPSRARVKHAVRIRVQHASAAADRGGGGLGGAAAGQRRTWRADERGGRGSSSGEADGSLASGAPTPRNSSGRAD